MPTVLITGASRGLGLEFARQFAGDGWRVIACCRSPGAACTLDQLRRARPESITVHALDVCRSESVRKLAAGLGSEAIDVLINNAGIWGPRPQGLGRTPYPEWAKAFNTNVMGPMRMVEALVDNVAASERKVIVMMSSRLSSISGNDEGDSYVYRSSKAALNAITRSLSVDLAERGVTCISLTPGWVRTDMGSNRAPLSPEESVAGMRRVIKGLDAAANGRFLTFEGDEMAW